MPSPPKKITIIRNGPYVVTGSVPIAVQSIGTVAGESREWVPGAKLPTKSKCELCRCGQSAKKPYCDKSHERAGFDGTETAPRATHQAQAQVIDGPTMRLADVGHLCSAARFCHPDGEVWVQVKRTDDPTVKARFTAQVGRCPSGRLVAIDKATGKAVEPRLAKSIGLVQDPARGCSGGLWIRGGIEVIAADGTRYEVRNRMTLCRCGHSRNKPFCDSAHLMVKFRDGLGG